MSNGYVIECPQCKAEIDDFSLADEWFCACGASGVLEYDDEEDSE